MCQHSPDALCSSSSPRGVPGPAASASLENVLEMQVLGSRPRPPELTCREMTHRTQYRCSHPLPGAKPLPCAPELGGLVIIRVASLTKWPCDRAGVLMLVFQTEPRAAELPASTPGPESNRPHLRAISLFEGEPSHRPLRTYIGTLVYNKPLTPSRWCKEPVRWPCEAVLSDGALGAAGHTRPFRFKLITLK